MARGRFAGKIRVRWSSLKEMLTAELESAKAEYSGLGYQIKQSWLGAGRRKGPNQLPWRKHNWHLESIALHSVAASTRALGKSYSDRIKEMFDIDKVIEAITTEPSVGAHYVIDRAGLITELARPAWTTFHAGKKPAHSNFTWGNSRSVGIELMGLAPNYRSDVIEKYEEFKAQTDDEEAKAWVDEFEKFVREEQGAEIPDFTDLSLIFYGFTGAQYTALNALIKVIAKRYGFVPDLYPRLVFYGARRSWRQV